MEKAKVSGPETGVILTSIIIDYVIGYNEKPWKQYSSR